MSLPWAQMLLREKSRADDTQELAMIQAAAAPHMKTQNQKEKQQALIKRINAD